MIDLTDKSETLGLVRELENVQNLLLAVMQASEAVDEGYGIKAIALVAANKLSEVRDLFEDTPGALILKKLDAM